MKRWGVVLALTLASSCVTPSTQECDGALCPADQACVPTVGCVDEALVTACADQAQFATCRAGGIVDGICYAEPGGEVRRCVAAGCGNGITEPTEACDDGNQRDDEACSADCQATVACGDGVVDWNETCDCGADEATRPAGCAMVNSDDPAATCRPGCKLPSCGDQTVVVPEDCEPGQALALGCTDLGFYGGDLTCNAACRYDVSACVGQCGDGVVSDGEACEPGVAPAATCEAFGFYGGTMGCNAACGLDLSGCAGTCGDGVQNGDEPCDGDDFGGAAPSCTAFGFYGGAVACNAACGYDLSACVGRCGDGARNGDESCDGGDFGGPAPSCTAFGYYRGEVGCNAACGIDVAPCDGTCGDGLREAPEDCEGADLGGATCSTLGYYAGTLTCGGGCRFDASGCAGRCGDGLVDPVEQCDGTLPTFGCGDFGGVMDRPTCSIGCSADALSCDAPRAITEISASSGRNRETRLAPDDGTYWSLQAQPHLVGEQRVTGEFVSYDLQGAGLVEELVALEVATARRAIALDCTGRAAMFHDDHWEPFAPELPPHACESALGLLPLEQDGKLAVYISGGTDVPWRWLDNVLEHLAGVPEAVDFAVCGDKLWALSPNGALWTAPPGEMLFGPETTVPGTWRELTCEHTADGHGAALWLTSAGVAMARLDLATSTTRTYQAEIQRTPWLLEPAPGLLITGGTPLAWHGRGWMRMPERLYGGLAPMGAGPTGDGVAQLVDESGRVRRAELLVLTTDYAPQAMAPVPGGLWALGNGGALLLDGVLVGPTIGGATARVWASRTSEAFVSSGGSIQACTPSGCGAAQVVSGLQIMAVAISDAGDAYASDATNNLFHWTGASWVATGRHLGAPVFVGAGVLLGVDANTVVQYTAAGNAVSTLATTASTLVGVGGSWPDEVYAVGAGGTILRREPATGAWALEPQELTTEVLRQVAVGGGRVLVRGDGDAVLQRDAGGWMRVDLGAIDVNVRDVQITSDGDVWVLGAGGVSAVLAPPP